MFVVRRVKPSPDYVTPADLAEVDLAEVAEGQRSSTNMRSTIVSS